MVFRVCVIGAGAAGLVALRHLTAKPHLYQAIAFERASVVGGTWVYTEKTKTDEHGQPIHSSMYRNLKTNLPKEVMPFIDYPFPKHLPSFVRHEDVRTYLEDYTDHFKIRDFIQFNTSVEQVIPNKTKNGMKWNVSVKSITDSKSVEQFQFDAVMVCNGHYSVPLSPSLPGLETFQGEVLHSHEYRHPESFTGKNVVCLGAAASGQDIALDLAQFAKQVTLCHRKAPLRTKLRENMQQKPGIKAIKEHSVVLENGEEIKLDVLLFCTGYKFEFPFLDKQCHLHKNEERLTPLYKHIIHAEYPTLSFIGICKTVCPFPHFECQVKFVLASMEGTYKLPSSEGMEADIEKDFKWRREVLGFPERYAHTMGDLQWNYNDMLAELGQFQKIPPVVHKLYNKVHDYRVTDLPGYKNINYEVTGSESFKVL